MGSASAVRQIKGRVGFGGAFSDLWTVNATLDPEEIAAGDEEAMTVTTGEAFTVGDSVIAIAPGVAIGNEILYRAHIPSAGVIVVLITNVHATTAVDIDASNWKFLVGRPTW